MQSCFDPYQGQHQTNPMAFQGDTLGASAVEPKREYCIERGRRSLIDSLVAD
jgi:hypothetical protein